MVTFVCSNCNSSLKKSQVQFHGCNGKFACITCNSDFNKTTFKTHDLCISEAEKYQGSDFKPKNNKGEARQANWNEAAIKALKGYQTKDSSMISVINQLKKKSNIPMKEDKFRNFLYNIQSSKMIKGCHETIWAILSPLRNQPPISSVSVTPSLTDSIEHINGDNMNKNEESTKDKKKRKNTESDDNESDNKKIKLDKVSEECSDPIPSKKSKKLKGSSESVEDRTEIKKDKIKKKKNSEVDSMEIDDNLNDVASEPMNDKKKKKKKSAHVEESNKEIEDLEASASEQTNDKKKKKKKSTNMEECNKEIEEHINDVARGQKKDKKNKKSKPVEEMDIVDEVLPVEKTKDKKKKSKAEQVDKVNLEPTKNDIIEAVPEKKKKDKKKNENQARP